MNCYSKQRKSYIKGIFRILKNADLWTLDQVYRLCVHITEPDDKEAVQNG